MKFSGLSLFSDHGRNASDDELWCNGLEICENKTCKPGPNPCALDLVCDEKDNACVECLVDADCRDNVFCDGGEICMGEVCQPGTVPCPNDGLYCNGVESCDEVNKTCLHSGNPCPEEKSICVEEPNGYACIPELTPPTIELIPDVAICSNSIPFTMLLFIIGAGTDFDSSTTISFNSNLIGPPLTFVLSKDLIFVFSMIDVVGIGDTKEGSLIPVEVQVTLDEGIGTDTLTLTTLP